MKPAIVLPLLFAAAATAQQITATPAEDPRSVAVALVESAPKVQPGPQHRWLQKLAGTWRVTSTTKVPGAKDTVAQGNATARAILGGRYVVVDTILEVKGQRVESVLILGFDALRGRFTSSWRDELSTWSIEGVSPREHEAAAKIGAGEAVDRIELVGQIGDAVTPVGRDFRMQVVQTGAETFEIAVADTLGDGKAIAMALAFERVQAPEAGKK